MQPRSRVFCRRSRPLRGREDVTHVAVAANFTEPAKEIAALFKQKTGHEAVLGFGRLGRLFHADHPWRALRGVSVGQLRHAQAAVNGGFAVAGGLFTYAIGKLVLWSRVIDVTDGEAALKAGKFQKLSIANPVSAPYGRRPSRR